jgi:molecular chaperone GrpE
MFCEEERKMAMNDDAKKGQSKAEKMNAGADSGKKWPTPDEFSEEEMVAGEAGEVEGSAEVESGDSAEAPALGHPSYKKLEDQLTETEQKLNEYWNEVMRARAEMENTRRRAAQDVEKARKFALEKFANDLLPIVDSLGHALDCEFGDNQFARSIHEGVEMTMNMLLQTFDRYGLKQINPVGVTFDPNQHQAVSMEENAEAASNTVIKVLQKGYLLNDRLIRPAMVVVAK